ncbi:hypothetical protein PR048_009675 [Dryococelus australis]|uniref:HTH CENPB-type domain-containing protein n=1 Tax=Dryococelus australis TaxID=614101 RepID=A0ABQ9I2E5_9NEOP|nr:hypothetical protein PR048_009675 [Dryococelus australis]
MPTEYKSQKTGAARGTWTEDNLKEAIARLQAVVIGVNEASWYYGIPSRTLRGVLGTENEKRLVRHIQRPKRAGFAPTRENIRSLAYKFADTFRLHIRFNSVTGMTGIDWFESFLKRNPELSISQSQGLSVARSEGLN